MNAIFVENMQVMREGVCVLSNMSFCVPQGSVYALLGGNGAGKSTTLLTLLGFLTPTQGRARLLEQDIVAHTAKVRKSIAYLPEAATLYPHLTAYENLDYFLDLAGKQQTKEKLDAALDRVALQTAARSKPMDAYSKGMRQKVAIALAILRDTPILLLDEPTSGLDPVAIDEFNNLVRQLANEGRTVLMVTHDVYGACQVANRIGLLRAGSLVGEFDAQAGERIDTQVVHNAFTASANS